MATETALSLQSGTSSADIQKSNFDTLINVAPVQPQPRAQFVRAYDTGHYSEPAFNNSEAPGGTRVGSAVYYFENMSWVDMEALRTSFSDDEEAILDAAEARYFPKEFAALLVERARIAAENTKAFAEMDARLGYPGAQIETNRPDALLTCLPQYSTPDKGLIVQKVDPKKMAQAQQQTPEARTAQPAGILLNDMHPPADALNTCLPAGWQ